MMPQIQSFVPILCGLALASATPLERRSVTPTVSSATVIGNFGDPTLDRDSCTSSRVGNREFWTCRDTENYAGEKGFFYASSASWSDFNADGTPKIVAPKNLTGYGNNSGPYFPLASDECGPRGFCSDGTRWVGWTDTRVLPVQQKNGEWLMYTWIADDHLKGLTNLNGPPFNYSLYRSSFDGVDTNDLPPVTLVNEKFWSGIGYGDYGWSFSADNTTAYLYGKAESGVALAKVPVGSIEDKSAYQYYYPATQDWSTTIPSYDDSTIAIPYAGSGYQGTFYYSAYFGSYVWIGASYGVGSDFNIATAPNAEGPWTKPTKFYTAEQGTTGLKDYSQQAHPGLTRANGQGNDIYLSYTRLTGVYSTPLIHIVWE